MEASAERRRRYVPRPPAGTAVLTPRRAQALRWIGELGIASLGQVAALVEAREQAARRLVRPLFDAGLVKVVAVPRAALAGPEAANDASLLHGSAPNVYVLTPAGAMALEELGLAPGRARTREPYGPRNALFLRHALHVRDARVGLELAARREGWALERWEDGRGAEIDLRRPCPPRLARPDAWFVLRLGPRVLAGLVEVDEGTERGTLRWDAKVASYAALFEGGRLAEALGYRHARVLVTVPDGRRRDRLAQLLAERAPAGLADRFWLAEHAALRRGALLEPAWRQPGRGSLQPLLPARLLQEAPRDGSAAERGDG